MTATKDENRPTVLAMREYIRNVNTIHRLMCERLLYVDDVSSETVVDVLDSIGQKCLSMSRDLNRTLEQSHDNGLEI